MWKGGHHSATIVEWCHHFRSEPHVWGSPYIRCWNHKIHPSNFLTDKLDRVSFERIPFFYKDKHLAFRTPHYLPKIVVKLLFLLLKLLHAPHKFVIPSWSHNTRIENTISQSAIRISNRNQNWVQWSGWFWGGAGPINTNSTRRKSACVVHVFQERTQKVSLEAQCVTTAQFLHRFLRFRGKQNNSPFAQRALKRASCTARIAQYTGTWRARLYIEHCPASLKIMYGRMSYNTKSGKYGDVRLYMVNCCSVSSQYMPFTDYQWGKNLNCSVQRCSACYEEESI